MKQKKTRMTRAKFIRFVDRLGPCTEGFNVLKRKLKTKPVRRLVTEYATTWQLWVRGKLPLNRNDLRGLGSDFNWLINTLYESNCFGANDLELTAADRPVEVVLGVMLAAVKRKIEKDEKFDRNLDAILKRTR